MKRIPFIFLSFLYSCANIQAPTGGIQDTAPPKLEASNPADRALNFKEKDITLTFDEPVELN
ncbi:MAG: Ig-like domain-containing protein, partial [Cytophagaceae bacterium]